MLIFFVWCWFWNLSSSLKRREKGCSQANATGVTKKIYRASLSVKLQTSSEQRAQWNSMKYLDIILCFNLLVLIRLFIGTPSANGFSFTAKDSYLASQAIKTVFFEDWLSCTIACQEDDNCASYNFNTFTGSCDLNEQGLQEPFSGPNELVKMQGMIFHQIRVSQACHKAFLCFIPAKFNSDSKTSFRFKCMHTKRLRSPSI